MRLVIAVLLGLVAVFVGVSFGWRWVLAPMLGLAILAWSRATLRGMVRGAGPPDEEPTPETGMERTLYWCEECGAEVVLTIRGAATAPRHCGTAMHERTELLG
jgi:hypothetical protein